MDLLISALVKESNDVVLISCRSSLEKNILKSIFFRESNAFHSSFL